jgi:hypothetical protein
MQLSELIAALDEIQRLTLAGTVKLMLVAAKKRRSSLALRAHAAALAPVTSAQIAKARARTLRYSAAVM